MVPPPSRRRAPAPLVAVALLAASLLAAACTSSAAQTPDPAATAPTTSVAEPRAGGTLRLGVGADATGWSPVDHAWTPAELQVARAVYDRLAVYDAGHQLQPELASAITPDPTFTTWTITLRPGVTFHDGSPLDAAAVVANLEAQRRSAPFGPLLAPLASVAATDPLTVVVASRTPWSTFPHVLAAQPGFVAAPATLADPAAPPVGSGPFTFEGGAPGATVSLARNPAYWQPGRPQLDRVVVHVVPDDRERAAALERGDLDVALLDDPVGVEAVATADDEGTLQLVLDREAEAPKLTVALDTALPPFIDVGARATLDSATDRQALWRAGLDGLLRPAQGPVADQSVWFSGDPVMPRDQAAAVAGAERYAERYGEPLAFTLLVPTEPVALRFAAAWQAQLAAAGIRVDLEPRPAAEVAARAAAGGYQAAVLPLFGSWHPDLWYPAVHRSQITNVGVPGPNAPRFGTAAIDEAMDGARATDDLAVQVDEYRTVQAELLASDAYVFLVRLAQAVGARPDVRDLTAWTTAEGRRGLPTEGGTVALTGVSVDRGR